MGIGKLRQVVVGTPIGKWIALWLAAMVFCLNVNRVLAWEGENNTDGKKYEAPGRYSATVQTPELDLPEWLELVQLPTQKRTFLLIKKWKTCEVDKEWCGE